MPRPWFGLRTLILESLGQSSPMPIKILRRLMLKRNIFNRRLEDVYNAHEASFNHCL